MGAVVRISAKMDRETERRAQEFSRKQCDKAATLIAPKAALWLSEVLETFCHDIRDLRLIDVRRPSFETAIRELKKIRDAAITLRGVLSSPYRELLEECEPMSRDPEEVLSFLNEIWIRSSAALDSSRLKLPAGKSKPGGVRVPLPGVLSGELACAIAIAEAWKTFNGKFPPHSNNNAGLAAEYLWQACQQKEPRARWATMPHRRWREHFAAAEASQAQQAEAFRERCRSLLQRLLGAK